MIHPMANVARPLTPVDVPSMKNSEILAANVELRSPWPHRLAVGLACATVLLICVGGLVTSLGAGMAFQDWPTSDGQNMFLYPWFRAAGDKFVEHGHRLFGALVGMITIALCVVLWFSDRRRWLRWLGVAALLLVIFQGVLGGMRVRASDVQLAKIHGCVAPIFLAVVVAIAIVTSRWWAERRSRVSSAAAGRMQRLALFATGLAYLQLVAGAHLRHVSPQSGADEFRLALVFHLLIAVALLVHAAMLFSATMRNLRGESKLIRPAGLLLALISVQLLLGGATWVLKYAWPADIFVHSRVVAGWTNIAGGVTQTVVVTTHVALGSLILATSLLATLRLWRGVQSSVAAAMPQANCVGFAI